MRSIADINASARHVYWKIFTSLQWRVLNIATKADHVYVVSNVYGTTIENCPRPRIEVPPTAFRTETLALTLTFELDFQSHDSYRSRSEITPFKSGNRQTDGRTDGGDSVTSRASAVGNNDAGDSCRGRFLLRLPSMPMAYRRKLLRKSGRLIWRARSQRLESLGV